jgi:hypothetical protein
MKQEYYWSLVIEPSWVQCAIWTIADDTTHVVSVGPTVAWETPSDLVNAVDASLSSAVTNVPEDLPEPSKTVFGVPPSWVEEGQIKKEFLDQIREVCHKLSLQPTGFVVIPEAISHFIKSEEGSPLNAVVIGVGNTTLDIAIFKLGNLVGTVNVGRSVSTVDDVVEGLTRFGLTDSVPSRFLLYDGKGAELEEVRQKLIQADWNEEGKGKVRFLHTPAVEIIDSERKTVAVSHAGASEIGNVSKVLFAKHTPEDDENEKEEEEEKQTENPSPQKEPVEAINFFQNLSPADVGFVVNKDIRENPVQQSCIPDKKDDNLSPVHKVERVIPIKMRLQEIFSGFKKPTIPRPSPKIAIARKPLIHTKQSFSLSPDRQRRPMIIGGIIFSALLIVGFVAWWTVPKAEVLLYIAPKSVDKKETLAIDPSISTPDISSRILPASVKSVEVSGEKSKPTTGTKTVGEKAKGNVQIRNGTGVAIKVNASTILVGPNDLRFSLDSAASVSGALTPASPGTAVVAVTAENIGAEYNLAKGATFKVGNYPSSEVDAIVDSDFSGGSSRQITVVSAEDLKALESDLLTELTDQGTSQLGSKINDGEMLITSATSKDVIDKQFSNKVGDEASTVRLTMKLRLTGLVVAESDLQTIAQALLQDQIPNGFVLRPEQLQTAFEAVGGTNIRDKSQFSVNFTANLLPQIDPTNIAKKIAGLYPRKAQEVLTQIPGFVRVQIKINPSLPGKLGTLPHLPKNISVEVSSER